MKVSLVLLHGWAMQLNPGWRRLSKILTDMGYKVYQPLLPGLTGPDLTSAWDLTSYAKWLRKYLQSNHINRCVLLGHSFGGSVALKFLSIYPADKAVRGLVLVNSAGIRPATYRRWLRRLVFPWRVLLVIYPVCWLRDFIRPLFYKLIGASDYYHTSGFLTLTLQAILAEDLTPWLDRIKAKVLLVWGQTDRDTPLAHGRIMRQKLSGSRLVIIPSASHSLPFTHSARLANLTNNFCLSL